MPVRGSSPPAPGDLRWTQLPGGSHEAVPLGNGRLVASVWFEPDGRLRAYLARGDSWSAHSRLLKVGRLGIRVGAAQWSRGSLHLSLQTATLTAELGSTTWRIWVDESADVLCVEADLGHESDVQVTLEPWRTARRALERAGEGEHDYGERWSAWGCADLPPGAVVETPDECLVIGDCIAALHENCASMWPETIRLLGLDAQERGPDPLLHRVTGVAVRSPGLDVQGRSLAGRVRRLHVEAAAVTTEAGGRAGWVSKARSTLCAHDGADSTTYARHLSWWQSFWSRSHLVASGDADADAVSAGYARQRYMAALAGRGTHPFPFNGSLFTVEAQSPDHPYDADYRAWGGAYWWQNTRLAYWPLLATGDVDLLDPLFAMYVEALPVAEGWVREAFAHPGAIFPEVMHFWGTWAAADYGRDRTDRDPGWVRQPYIRRLWTGSLELVALALARWRQRPDDDFLSNTVLPLADRVLTFFSEHYPLHEGRLRLSPAQALETYWAVEDPAPDVAGLHHLMPLLLESGVGTPDMRARWQWLYAHLPPMPSREGLLLPARTLVDATHRNRECPELYALFPFDVGVPEQVLHRTFDARRAHPPNCWLQDDLWAACLGRTTEAVEGLVARARCTLPGFRWPATWDGEHDWAPDQDHGGVLMLTMQRLALYGVDTTGHPTAWPPEWRLDGSLHTASGRVHLSA